MSRTVLSTPERSRQQRRAAAASRRLRALVSRLRGCVASLPPVSARLLGLRTGLFGRPALGAPGTARRLRVTLAHEQRLEHRALVSLRAATSTGCAAARSAAASVAAAGSTIGSALGAGTSLPVASHRVSTAGANPAGRRPQPAAGTNPAGRLPRRRGVTRGSVSRGHSSTGHAPTPTERANSPAGTTNRVLILLLLAVAVAGGFALLREDRRPWHRRPVRPGSLTAAPDTPAGARAPPDRLPLTPAPAATPIRPRSSPDSRPAAPPIAPPAPGQPASSTPRPASPAAPAVARRWSGHEAKLAAVTLAAIVGGAARVVRLARRRSARRR